ncbi:MAG: hypothetical protein M1169_07870, partial [Firmicutes bacterium]|nr:hypothetical protein [Bacillota bacterium]
VSHHQEAGSNHDNLRDCFLQILVLQGSFLTFSFIGNFLFEKDGFLASCRLYRREMILILY